MNKDTRKYNSHLDDLINYLKLNPKSFANSLGFDRTDRIYNVLKGANGVSTDLAKIITERYTDVNYEWLISGKGSMLNKQQLQVKGVTKTDTTNFEKLPIEEKLNSIYDLLINSSTDSSNSVESLIHGLVSKDAHQDKYINFMRDKIIELENSLEIQKNMTIQILEIVKDLKLSTH